MATMAGIEAGTAQAKLNLQNITNYVATLATFCCTLATNRYSRGIFALEPVSAFGSGRCFCLFCCEG